MKERIEYYKNQIQVNLASIDTLTKLSRRYAMYRLAVIVIGLILIFTVGQYSATILSSLILATLIAFLYLIKVHLRLDKQRQRVKSQHEIHINEIATLEKFKNLYYDGADLESNNHFYANDLDVFGLSSLYAVINRSRTFHGTLELGYYFSEKHKLESINDRNVAVKELENDTTWRLEFLTDLFELENQHHENFATKVKEQLDGDLNFLEAGWLKIYRKFLPVVWLGLIGLTYWKWDLGSSLMTMFFLVNLGVTMKYYKPITEIQNRLAKSDSLLEKFILALRRINSRKWKAPLSVSKVALGNMEDDSERNAIGMLSELKKIVIQLDARLNMIAAVVLNGTVLWDIMIVEKLAQWKNNNLNNIEEVFQQIGYFEAITSLATWAYNHPMYCYADLDTNHFHLVMKGGKHPLIGFDSSVPNDFSINKNAPISIITGSNMAGKSTFLRTIGTNMLLAFAGTRVAADTLSTSVVQLMCYMRIKDALEESTSTFKAELNRIEMMLSLIDQKEECLMLIDEMLRGTNSKDKLRGSINITKKLISHHAYSVIATHDIKLAELDKEYPESIENYFFDIDYEDGALKFDYKIKNGICENFNASFLLEQIGIG